MLETSVRMIIHGNLGECTAADTLIRLGILRVDDGEAWGLIEVIKWVKYLNLSDVIVEIDSKRVSSVINGMKLLDTTFGDITSGGRKELRENLGFMYLGVSKCKYVGTYFY